MKDANDDEFAVRREYRVSKSDLYRTIKPKSKAGKKFRFVMNEYIIKLYNNSMRANLKKVKHLKKLQDQEVEKVAEVEEIFGVKVGDNSLP